MKKIILRFSLIALLLVYTWIASAAIDSGRQYSSTINQGAWLNSLYEIFKISQEYERSAAVKPVLLKKMRSTWQELSSKPESDLSPGALLLRKILHLEKNPGLVGFRELSVLARQVNWINTGKKSGVEHQSATSVTPFRASKAISGDTNTSAVTATPRSGHFYKPFLERPEMFY